MRKLLAAVLATALVAGVFVLLTIGFRQAGIERAQKERTTEDVLGVDPDRMVRAWLAQARPLIEDAIAEKPGALELLEDAHREWMTQTGCKTLAVRIGRWAPSTPPTVIMQLVSTALQELRTRHPEATVLDDVWMSRDRTMILAHVIAASCAN